MTMVLVSSSCVTVISGGNRLLPFFGGHYERRILRSPSSDSTTLSGPVRRADLSRAASFAALVPQVVDPLPRVWPRRVVRLQSHGSSSRPSHVARLGTYH